MTPGKNLSNIQILRGFAALNVVLFHSILTAKKYEFPANFLSPLNDWGKSGVDIFFVISGFIMVFIQMNRHYTPIQFLINRLIRIVPLYWFLTIGLITLYCFVPQVFAQMKLTPIWVACSFLFISGPAISEYPIVYLGWTLEYEILFYLVFSMSLFFKNMNYACLFTAFIIGTIALTAQNFLMLEFLFGMFVGLLFFSKRFSKRVLIPTLTAGIFALILNMPGSETSIDRAVLWGIPATFIIFGAVNLPQLQNQFATRIGDASYSIYLIQIFTIPAFFKAVTLIDIDPSLSDILIVACVIITAISGYILYRIFENPLIKGTKHLLENAPVNQNRASI